MTCTFHFHIHYSRTDAFTYGFAPLTKKSVDGISCGPAGLKGNESLSVPMDFNLDGSGFGSNYGETNDELPHLLH
jgi:hypothetical protein